MVAYSFGPRFEKAIRAGTKHQTIRAIRRDRRSIARRDCHLQLYFGMRTKHCRLIGTAVCADVQELELRLLPPDFGGRVTIRSSAGAGTQVLTSQSRLDEFAVADGFSCWADLLAFWAVQHPNRETFRGVLIRWKGFTEAPGR